jgi:glycosidase
MREDETSILHLYRALLAARRASPALHGGDLTLLDAPDGVLAYERRHGDDVRRVIVNFTSDRIGVGSLMTGWRVDISSSSTGGRTLDAAIHSDEAVVLSR